MIQLAVFIYGIVVLFRGVFALGRSKKVVGTRARVLGLLCVLILPFAFTVGLSVGLLVNAGVMDMPPMEAMVMLDLGCLIIGLVVIFIVGNAFYRAQERERIAADSISPSPEAGRPRPTIADPDNPYASPTLID